jgi:periplasmic divalent cation tolerance protein
MKKKHTYIVIYTTFPHLRIAHTIIRALLTKRIAACGNIFKLSSLYIWGKKIEKSPEYGAFIKTKKSHYKQVEKYIREHHPYEVPEIISWTIGNGLPRYLRWIEKETSV